MTDQDELLEGTALVHDGFQHVPKTQPPVGHLREQSRERLALAPKMFGSLHKPQGVKYPKCLAKFAAHAFPE